MIMRKILAVSVLAMSPAIVSAEGFSSGYVTGFASEVECMNMARSSINAQFTDHGATPDTGEGSYSIYGFDVPPGISQIAVVCTEQNGTVIAAITGYSIVENGTRLETVQAMIDRINGEPPTPPGSNPANPTPAPTPGGNGNK